MRPSFTIFALTLLAITGCSNHTTQRSPSLTGPAAGSQQFTQPATPPSPGFFRQVGDTTWNVVTAPARMVFPEKRKPAPPPEIYEAPQAMILDPNPPSELPPAPATAPATQP